MTVEIESIKALVRDVMERDFTMVPTPSGRGDRVHLEVWAHRRTGLPIGLEMGHSTMVNLWLVRSDVPMDLPLTIPRINKEPDDDGWTDADGAGANHNLIHYRQFFGRPMTRLALTSLQEAQQVLSRLTRGDVRSLVKKGPAGNTGDAFVLKINGLLHAPQGICRPATSDDWEGGMLSMPLEGQKVSSRYDNTAGRAVEPSAALYIWTHEDKAFGHGKGLTAKATAGRVSIDEGILQIELTDVRLLPHPFGFQTLGDKFESNKLLTAMGANRHLRCWHMDPEDRNFFEGLIETFGSAKAAAMAAAEAAYLTPLQRAIKEFAEEIEQAEEERKTSIVKARPGQQRFREEAMRRHNGRCVVTGFSVAAVLDAAHVIPHTGAPEFEVPENSLVLRRDIHALFDAHLIAIHPKTGAIVCCPSMAGSKYPQMLAGRVVDHKLAPESLAYQFSRFNSATKISVPQ
jgi:hypothetical protein